MSPEFAEYQKAVVENAKVFAASLAAHGFRIVSGGTDNHLFLVDVFVKKITGKVAEKALDNAGEETASKVAAAIKLARGGRSEGAILVVGGSDLGRLKGLLASVRSVEGVAGAYLGDWRGEDETVILRVCMTGLKIDGLAARLLRRDPSLTLLSVEAEDGRLGVELPGRGDE